MHINNPKHHRMYEFRSQELKWLCSDSEDRFKQNLKRNHHNLQKYGWLDREITYKLNSEGFRCDEFSNEDSIVFLGPSFTAGIGLCIEDIFPTIVANELKLKCFNLAIPGTSNDTAFRMAYTWLEKIKPKIVVFHSEYKERFELLDYDISHNLLPSAVKTQYHRIWLEIEENSYVNKLKNSLAVNCLCDRLQIKFIELDRRAVSHKQIDYTLSSRDLIHPGAAAHKAYADIVLEMIGA